MRALALLALLAAGCTPPDTIEVIYDDSVEDWGKADGAAGAGPPRTMDEVARDTLDAINPVSIMENIEYHFIIYTKDSGPLRATKPTANGVRGGERITILVPRGAELVAMAHTHGDYTLFDPRGDRPMATDRGHDQTDADRFSTVDEDYMRANPQKFEAFYLGTPSGKLLKKPKNGRTQELQPLPATLQ